ncbi:hypothetical protein BGW39_000987, partial [Mortierella sp. 14UC]
MSVISKTGQDFDLPDCNTEATNLHIPVLTRTKARTSCKKKNKGMISLFSSATSSSSSGAVSKKQQKQQKQQQATAAAALEIARSASAIIIQVQEPSELASSARPLTPTTSNIDTNTIQNTTTSSDDPEEDISPINPTSEYLHPYTNNSTRPLIRLEMPSTISSSSIVRLYESAKSSPNGSMVDAASARAIYCTSLKSAISFLPTESTSTLGAMQTSELNPSVGVVEASQDSDEKEIVIASAG